MEMKPKARLIAFYLPQYHPIPENDLWWGRGFTEWTNVASAKPLFPGHDQPRLPGELGFYDLRLPEVRQAQADLARTHGVEGFCYWHYWMGAGNLLLQRPFEEVLRSGQPNFPFCLGWANHSWTRTWFGAQQDVLMRQEYPGQDDHRRHFDYILPALLDPRYMRVDGKPLFYLFRPNDIPQVDRFIDLWRKLAQAAGLDDFYLVGQGAGHKALLELGYDASCYCRPVQITRARPKSRLARGLQRVLNPLRERVRQARKRPQVYEYSQAAPYFLKPGALELHEHPCVTPGWDNTPRMGAQGLVLDHATPEMFRQHVRQAFQQVCDKPPEQRLLFLKSWNEWAEGCILEPDARNGRAFLETLRSELTQTS